MSQTHRASVQCRAPARTVYRFLADGRMLGRWSLACLGARRVAPGLYRGRSLFDGKALLVRPVGDEANLTVHYFAGPARKALAARLYARVRKRGPRRCTVTLVAQREPGMSAASWRRLRACLAVETRVIQAIVGRKRRT